MTISAEALARSVESIRAVQQANGLILWNRGGHADPWNHVEAAMALDLGGLPADALRAYEWLADHQLDDGSWHQYYVAAGIEDAKFDANTIAYVATGVRLHYLVTRDDSFLATMWPTLERAIDWVMELQQPTGEIHWAREPDGTPFHYALVTGSASMSHSIGQAVAVAETLGKDRPEWREGRERLLYALRHHETEFFAPKTRWAMDWYYPVLTGVVRGGAARQRMRSRWVQFVHDGVGVRCVDDHDWITTGETAECAMACVVAGMHDEAAQLLEWVEVLRGDDGAYFTGLAFPDRVHFPADERTSYSAAAIILAHDMINGGPSNSVFGPAE